MKSLRIAAAMALLFAAVPAIAQTLTDRVEAVLAEAPTGTRFGIVVTDADGNEIVAINPWQRFIPASNTKMFTTAAAFMALTGLDESDPEDGTRVRLAGKSKAPDVILEGSGDARLSSAPDCTVDCLATLADAVAAKTRTVHDVIGDDSWFPDERWSPGMSWNNIPTRSGTGISALTLDDNEFVAIVTPGAVGERPTVTMPGYYQLKNEAMTMSSGDTDLGYERDPNTYVLRITGRIGADAEPARLRMGVDDPARYAAWTLREMLRARGVKVTGTVSVVHRPLADIDDPAKRDSVHIPKPGVDFSPSVPFFQRPLARLTPPPLAEDLTIINKVSQNLHAELMLRRLGRIDGLGSIADGQAVVRAMLAKAGVPRTAFDFSDGSGMSSYNRVAPGGAVILLRWIAAQPWGAAWRATLPIGGVDGTVRRRFAGTILEGKLFAKTGTLNATTALSGYLTAKSGKTLIFSTFANDIPEDASVTKFVDAALVMIAEAN